MKLRTAASGLFSLLLVSLSATAGVKPIQEVFSPDSSLYPKDQYGKVAVVQWAPSEDAPLLASPEVTERYKQRNRKALERYIREAHKNGAELIITPEFATVGYPNIPELPSEEDNFRNRQDLEPFVEQVPGKTTEFFSKLAKELKVTLHIGLAEVDAVSDLYYNTIAVIDPQGKIVTKYRKIHLFQQEHDFLAKGDKIVTYQGAFGKVGIIICSDIYSSFPMEHYRNEKLDVMALSTSWAQYNTGWRFFIRGARWVNAPLLASNQSYFPDSGVINADGTSQSHIRQSTGIAYGFLRYKKP